MGSAPAAVMAQKVEVAAQKKSATTDGATAKTVHPETRWHISLSSKTLTRAQAQAIALQVAVVIVNRTVPLL